MAALPRSLSLNRIATGDYSSFEEANAFERYVFALPILTSLVVAGKSVSLARKLIAVDTGLEGDNEIFVISLAVSG